MRLVDTHAHLAGAYCGADRIDRVLERAWEAGLAWVLNVGTHLGDSREAVALGERCDRVWASAGVHPHEASSLDGAALEALRDLAGHPRVVAVGECGLDYHYDRSPRERQREALRAQVRLARDLGLPLVLHNRESDEDLVRILVEEGAGEVGGVVHAFSAAGELAERLLDLGLHLGFGGMITFPRAHSVRSALRRTPLDRLLLETDSPYLTPVPHRGERNEPCRVRAVAERAARELGVPAGELAERTTENAARLFRVSAPETTPFPRPGVSAHGSSAG